MRRFLFLLFVISTSAQDLPVIPKPVRAISQQGTIAIGSGPDLVTTKGFGHGEAMFFTDALKTRKSTSSGVIVIERSPGQSGSYVIEPLPPSVIKIKAPDADGVFNAVQTLIQLLPPSDAAEIPSISVSDAPKFPWRGMHLDCVRHFFPPGFIKKYIDYLAMYKLNVFHWHLTDDQGWRIEIKKYPKLTEIGSKRKGTMTGPYADHKVDEIPYGGFYTQDEIRDIVKYAAARHVTIVPEIEMPGHAMAALAAYPELSCTGGPFEVATTWGVFDDVFCPTEQTFTFLEHVLDEVMDLFPSSYIHIGGDECPKTRWKTCPKCQALIREKNLGDENGLQSYFIRRISEYVNSKGRKIIGWNEILQGGLAPGAAVMSWQGTQGAVDAAKQGHDAVMTPESCLYFDRYQGDAKTEPLAFGGYVPVEKVYGFNPVPTDLSADQARHIIGVQANLWTEYIPSEKQAEYMLFPRIAALSEVAWGTARPTDFPNFQKRLEQHFGLYDKFGINYSRAIYDVKANVVPLENGIGVALSAHGEHPEIGFSMSGEPGENSTVYSVPLKVTQSQVVKAARFENGKKIGSTVTLDIRYNKATGKKIELKNPPSEHYPGDGAFTLVNGVSGDKKRFGNDWLGFEGNDLEATIDLGEKQEITSVTTSFMQSAGSWIYYPKRVSVSVSKDGVTFKPVGTADARAIENAGGTITSTFKKTTVRFVKITAENTSIIPDGSPGAGNPAWLFTDEISIDR